VDALQFPVLEFDQEDARPAGEIRAHLPSKGMPIGPYDVLIAGQAKARKLTLVTHNTTEFTRVPGLKVEDWKGATRLPPAASSRQRASKLHPSSFRLPNQASSILRQSTPRYVPISTRS
jgi:hypothetical protein